MSKEQKYYAVSGCCLIGAAVGIWHFWLWTPVLFMCLFAFFLLKGFSIENPDNDNNY